MAGGPTPGCFYSRSGGNGQNPPRAPRSFFRTYQFSGMAPGTMPTATLNNEETLCQHEYAEPNGQARMAPVNRLS